MAKDIPGVDLTFTAAADLSAKQFYLMELASGGVNVANAAGNYCIGVLQNEPTSGQAAWVRCDGVSRCIASEAIAVNDLIAATSAGKAKVAVKGRTDTTDTSTTDPLVGSSVIGVALTAAAADGEYFDLLILHMGAMTTTES